MHFNFDLQLIFLFNYFRVIVKQLIKKPIKKPVGTN
jgi:hypothetical protein